MFKKFPKLTFAPLVLLLIPLIAMQFSEEVQWGILDFVLMGILLLVAGMWTQRVIERIRSKPNRILYISFILLLFLLFWVEMAVGIFGSPIAGS